MAEDIEKHLRKYFAGEATIEEERKVLFWLSSVKNERVVKASMESDWKEIMSDEALVAESPELWALIKRHLDKQEDSSMQLRERFIERQPKTFIWSTLLKAAAIFVLFIGIVFAISQWGRQGTGMAQGMVTRSAPNHAAIHFKLADGSTIYLNKGSKISFQKDFSLRTVTLDGEGFFEVKKDPARPFQVHIGDLVVKVLGTKFNVSSYAARPNIEVYLSEGSVSVKEKDKEYILKPGERAVYNKQSFNLVIDTSDADTIISWTGRKLIFKNDPLPVVLKKLEKRYMISTRIVGAVDKDCLFNAVIENDSLATVLELIKISSNSTYTVKGDSVIVYPGRCK